MKPTVIIPFHENVEHLAQALTAAKRSLPGAEFLIAADAPVDDCTSVAARSGVRVIHLDRRSGPAVARNRAAAQANGDVLVFVDADVVVAADALSGMCQLLAREPNIAGVFGAYGMHPSEPNFMSQYKNLMHAYVHETANRDAMTFWAGLGAVRAAAFRQVGGFDESFRRPSVEDIDLGYRLRRAGYRLRLDPRFRGEHLKRWTLWSSILTDVRARGIPWTQLLLKYHALSNDLNLRMELRLSVVLAYLFVASAAALATTAWAGMAALAALVAIVIVNRRFYGWFARQRGVAMACRIVPLQVLHHLCNGLSFVAGATIYYASRLGIDLPGALPRADWKG